MSGIKYRYRFAETYAACAEHDDPTCLCDVVIKTPTQVSKDVLYYEYAEAIEERVGTPAWWAGILAAHDLEKYAEKYHESGVSNVDMSGIDMGQFLLDTTDESVNAADVARRYGLSPAVVQWWRAKWNIHWRPVSRAKRGMKPRRADRTQRTPGGRATVAA
jgi:hypothetical protein